MEYLDCQHFGTAFIWDYCISFPGQCDQGPLKYKYRNNSGTFNNDDNNYNNLNVFSIPLTNTDVTISAEPNTFSPWHKYLPSSDLEAFRIRRLPSGRTVILKIIKNVFIR